MSDTEASLRVFQALAWMADHPQVAVSWVLWSTGGPIKVGASRMTDVTFLGTPSTIERAPAEGEVRLSWRLSEGLEVVAHCAEGDLPTQRPGEAA